MLGEVTISPDRLAVSLLAFNLGVEAGQLLILALTLPVLRWMQRREGAWLNVPNAMVSAAACYWLVQRSIA